MPTSSYAFVSLPLRIFDSGDKQDALSSLSATVTSSYGTVLPFHIPDFKIGTLDALVQHADDLAKLDAGCEGVVSRVADSLKNILDSDEDKVAQQKMVNDSQLMLPPLTAPTELELISSYRAYGQVYGVLQLEQSQVQGRPSARRVD